MGIGTAILKYLEKIAKKRDGVEQISLYVVEENIRAIHLYKKCGFSIVAVLPRTIKTEDGRYPNRLLMQKLFK